MFYADSMPDREHEEDENSRAKEQAEDHQDGADASEKRADKSPHLKVGMDSQVARARAEMAPRIWTAQQDRRGVNEKEDADADAQEEEPKIGVLSKESHFHGAMIKRFQGLRKSNLHSL
jgi:hypothetical protein